MIYAIVIHILSLLVGCFYPAFASYKILKSQNCSVNDLRGWLIYWIAYGVYVAFDYFTAGLLAFIPLLSEFKVLLLFWMLPSVGGGSEVLGRITLEWGELVWQQVCSVLSHLMVLADRYLLPSGHRPALQITPSIEDLVNDAIAKRQLEEKRKQMGNLSDTINEVLGENIDLNMDLLHGSESDLLVIKEPISKPKERPIPPPKPMRQPSSSNQQEMNLSSQFM
uniref:Receptor expression-enhancing protein n=1 Tax=Drosophila melanogaster TaxID=7227 RepID=M9PH97_DROME|nr:receptor accessory protein like 1, isoform B [Drosophila melanogaster]AGB95295.1 receptor accessory protein like 1, isoform B [Drosophila melanogaster]|eukprot:NP_001259452.1 receptor accessory protein like 1, isoform B [Drosophila melanogaster]